jgi:hypothetical protein
MSQERWIAEQCATHVGITISTWRDYVADGRAPAALPGYDPETGRKTWDPATVRTWHAHRPGQGARTDLTHLPDPHGHPVFINPTTITTATHTPTIPRSALRQQFTQQIISGHLKNHTEPQSPHAPHVTNTPTTRQINKALGALYKLGAIRHDRQHITIIDQAILARIATL